MRVRTRTQLTDAARVLIAEKGVAGLRIGDVTEVADVGRGSFYNYFDSKEALIEAVAGESIEDIARRVLADIDDADPAVLAATADRRFIRLAYEDPDFARLLVNLGHGSEVFSTATVPYARAALQIGIDAGRFDVADFDVLLILLTTSAFALIRSILEGEAPPNADQAHAEAILRALGVDRDEAREIARRPLENGAAVAG
jgi:AcrR family transcriptional regulator